MGTLTQALKNLTPNERRAALEDLVANGLRNQDIRFLMERLKEDCGRFIKDPCAYPKLPIEIIVSIAKYLPLEDFHQTQLVSKLWNAKFSSEEVRLCLVKIHFRTAWERDYMSLGKADVEQRLLGRSRFMSWFPEQVKQQLRWQRGHNPYRLLVHEADQHALTEEDEARQYSNGRVAFMTERGIVVQPLSATSPPRTFRDVDRQNLRMWRLSDQLLVAKKATELVVYVWQLPVVTMAVNNNLETPPYEMIRTPSDVRHISAHRYQIGLILTSDEILIWQVGGVIKLIDTSKINTESLQQKPSAFGLIFHPVNEGHFFVFYQWIEHNHRCRILVLEVQSDGVQHLVPLEELIPEDEHSKGFPHGPNIGPTTVRIADPNGLCVITWETKSLEANERAYRVINFNLYEKKFAFYPPIQPTATLKLTTRLGLARWGEIRAYIVDISQILIWRNSLLVPVCPAKQKASEAYIIEDPIIIRICPYDNMEQSLTWAAWNDKEEKYANGEEEVLKAEQVSPREEVRWYSANGKPVVRGDDDYVVMFADQVILVWKMDAKVRKDTFRR